MQQLFQSQRKQEQTNMEKWMVAAKRADFKEIGEHFGIDQVTARIIRNRDVIGEEAIEKYLHGSRKDFYSPWLLKDMEKAVAILQEKITNKNKIRIIGDYDIDGVMSTYILLVSLRGLGADADMVIQTASRTDMESMNI